MGVETLRMIVRIAAVLFLFLGVVYFLSAENWFSKHTKIAGIVLASLVLIMIAGILGIMIILAK